MSTLALTMLGSFQALRDGTPITQFRGDKVRALLVYLAVESDRPHTRASLCGLLWPDQGDDAALQNLSQSLGRLRAALGEGGSSSLLPSSRQTIQWNMHSGAQVDVAAFVRLARASTTAELEQAVQLYHGAFMPGFSIPGCPEFDEWLLLTREYLERLALTTLDRLTQTYLAAGANSEAEGAARRVLALDPWRETAHRQVMAALAGAGQRGAALAQYDACVRTLADELGLAPDEATTALYEAIKSGTWQPEAGAMAVRASAAVRATAAEQDPPIERSSTKQQTDATSWQLPAPLTAMLGRESELAQIVELLERDGERLITVAGGGGVGKTRLALAAAHLLIGQDVEVCWIALAGAGGHHSGGTRCGEQTATQLAVAIAEASGLSLKGDKPETTQVLDALRRRSVVLVLDNLEHMLAGTPWLLELLQRAPAVRLLVTSRERLNVDAEVVLPLTGLALPETDDDPQAAGYSAVQLFLQRAARAAPTLSLCENDLEAVVGLCRLLDGVPLGLELAAHWVAHYRIGEIAAALVENISFLATTRREYPERHRSLKAVFAYSWQLLTPEEQHALARISVFQGSFSREAAQAVARTEAAVLAALVDKSLLRQAGVGTYAVHELLRQFSAEHLAEQDDAVATRDRHADYFLELVARCEARLAGGASRESVTVLRSTFDNIRAAWYWAVERRSWQPLENSVTSLMLYFRLTGEPQALQPALAALAALADDAAAGPQCSTGNLRLEAVLNNSLAHVYTVLIRRPEAIAAAQRALECARASNDTLEEAHARLLWAQVLVTQRTIPAADAVRADELLRQAIGGAREVCTDDPFVRRRAGAVEAESLQFVGQLASRQFRFEEAKAWFAKALQTYRESGNDFCLEALLSYHASAFENDGLLGQGRLYRELALAQARACGTRDGEGIGLHNLAWAMDYLGEYDTARRCIQQATTIRSQLGCKTFIMQHQHSRIALHQRDFPAALGFARQALDESRSTGDVLNGAPVWVAIGEALNGMRRWSEAQAAFEQANTLARELGDDEDIVPHAAHAGLARAALAQGKFQQARMHAEIVWSYLSTHCIDLAYEPLGKYLICYQAFLADGDARAAVVLEAGYALLMRLAGAIEQPSWRRSFLENVSAHRAIARRWTAATRDRQALEYHYALGA